MQQYSGLQLLLVTFLIVGLFVLGYGHSSYISSPSTETLTSSLYLVTHTTHQPTTDSLKDVSNAVAKELSISSGDVTLGVLSRSSIDSNMWCSTISVAGMSNDVLLAKWSTALANGFQNRIPVDSGEFFVSSSCPTSKLNTEQAISEEINSHLTIPSYSHNDMITAMESRATIMQLKLKNSDFDNSVKVWSSLDRLIGGVRSSVGRILRVPEDYIILYNIKSGSVVIQFSVYPSTVSDLELYSERWTSAVQKRDTSIIEVFDDVDFQYPPVVEVRSSSPTFHPTSKPISTTIKLPDTLSKYKDSSTTEKSDSEDSTLKTLTRTSSECLSGTCSTEGKMPSEEGPSMGVVAGVVLGSLAGVALIGGGTAGYMYKQKQREHSLIMSTSQHNRKGQDFGDISPGGREVSPNGLSNVDIRGETTPNPHNYR